jgi:hypothetical protein
MAGDIAEMMLDGTMDCETGEWNFGGEDGPGWPMTGTEAAAFKGESYGHAFARYRATPRRPFVTERRPLGIRPQKPRKAPLKERQLYGFWRGMALAMKLGCTTPALIGAAMDRPATPGDVRRALEMMKASGLAHDELGQWRLTKRGVLRLGNTD